MYRTKDVQYIQQTLHETASYSSIDQRIERDCRKQKRWLWSSRKLVFGHPQLCHLTPSTHPLCKFFENLKIYNLHDHAFSFVTFAHRLQRPSSQPSWRPTSTDEPLQHKVLVLLQLIYVNSDVQHTAYGQRMYLNWKRMHYNKD